LAAAAIKAVREGRIKILPRSWTKTYYHWMENIRPWCISRQLWWGHRIPAWDCDADGSVHVSRDDLQACPQCKGPLRQVADTLDVMVKYGTDAFRFTLAALGQGRDIRISEDRIEGYRNFANKLWNASRLVLSNLDGFDAALARKTPPAPADVWIESRLAVTIAEVRTGLRRYRFGDAASSVYQFVWHELCDWYLEIAKLSLYRPESAGQRARTQATLVRVLEATLRLLHPFMPFITEEIWQRLPHKGESIMIAPYPRVARKQRNPDAERE